ncbi:hypothetical protein K469DRAFT_796406 [Zopfia rhizophila CBS 207.26]|uniref:Uncharacterized protein n=1 Tax=Zopfia rhizophila CBS 207.26 TaxID=1314779 RepID=A0A6A6DRG9_9PEZI|nr:hypothetical protein K469DRAFT_796406 [Zopfia rhizophila CBS 207.26]
MHSFYYGLEEPTRETCCLAFDPFDRYGCLKNEFKEHPTKKVSGIWNAEFGRGDLLLIVCLHVKKPYRHQGLERKLVLAILEKARAKFKRFFAVTAPGWLNPEVSKETQGGTDEQVKAVQFQYTDIAEDFFRSLGSRLNPCLLEHRNDTGETAQEALELLEIFRTQREYGLARIDHVSDKFTGFSENSVACLIRLKWLHNPQSEILCLKYGCTCGRYIGGFSASACDSHSETRQRCFTTPSAIPPRPSQEKVLFNLTERLRFVPDHVRANLKTNKSMRQSFTNLFLHFTTCVKKNNNLVIPNKPNFLQTLRDASEWPPHSCNYLRRDGAIYLAASSLSENAMIDSLKNLAGTGGMFFLFPGEEEMEDFGGLRPERGSLLNCRNDHEFGFVSAMCGYKKVSLNWYVDPFTRAEIEPDKSQGGCAMHVPRNVQEAITKSKSKPASRSLKRKATEAIGPSDEDSSDEDLKVPTQYPQTDGDSVKESLPSYSRVADPAKTPGWWWNHGVPLSRRIVKSGMCTIPRFFLCKASHIRKPDLFHCFQVEEGSAGMIGHFRKHHRATFNREAAARAEEVAGCQSRPQGRLDLLNILDTSDPVQQEIYNKFIAALDLELLKGTFFHELSLTIHSSAS